MARPRKDASTDHGPTDRQKSVADMVRGGKSVEEAMGAAGYGPGFIAGVSGDFKTFLEKIGVSGASTAPAGRARAAAPAAADKEG